MLKGSLPLSKCLQKILATLKYLIFRRNTQMLVCPKVLQVYPDDLYGIEYNTQLRPEALLKVCFFNTYIYIKYSFLPHVVLRDTYGIWVSVVFPGLSFRLYLWQLVPNNGLHMNLPYPSPWEVPSSWISTAPWLTLVKHMNHKWYWLSSAEGHRKSYNCDLGLWEYSFWDKTLFIRSPAI